MKSLFGPISIWSRLAVAAMFVGLLIIRELAEMNVVPKVLPLVSLISVMIIIFLMLAYELIRKLYQNQDGTSSDRKDNPPKGSQ